MEKRLKEILDSTVPLEITPARSRLMQSIRGKGNRSTELTLRMLLVRMGIKGWSLHAKLPGKPDFLFREHKLAVFVDGCFWHGCASCGHTPKTRSTFWAMKLELNRLRDLRFTAELQQRGYRVLRVWEHEFSDLDKVSRRIAEELKHASDKES
jgi:DNA mismatch endonuclease, patch repair protein